jgi:hypothetical protein
MEKIEYPFKPSGLNKKKNTNVHRGNVSRRRKRISADGTGTANKHERKAKMDKAMKLILRWNDILSCENCVFNKIGNNSDDCKGSIAHADGRKKFCVEGNKWFYYCKAKLAISDERIMEMKFDNLSDNKEQFKDAHYTVYEKLQIDESENNHHVEEDIDISEHNSFSMEELAKNGVI